MQFLRTTYKAGPLVALGLAMPRPGCGAAARLPRGRALAWSRRRSRRSPLVACWPLIRGPRRSTQLMWERVPPPGRGARGHVDAHRRDDGRAVVLPGQLYAYYDWGGTIDPILPALADAPVAIRNAVAATPTCARPTCCGPSTRSSSSAARCPASSTRCWTCWARARSCSGADDDRTRSGAAPAAEAADVLDAARAARRAPGARCGAQPRAAGTLGAPRAAAAGARLGPRPARRPLVRRGARSAARPSSTAAPKGSPGSRRSAPCPAGRIAYAGDLGRRRRLRRGAARS